MPSIVACGGRKQAYDDFCTALRTAKPDDFVILLVDSEAPLGSTSWEHVRNRPGDGWIKPSGITDDHLQFMVQCMETWFLADRQLLIDFFRNGFQVSALPQNTQLEAIPKDDVQNGLIAATRQCGRDRKYAKGRRSFRLLEHLDPATVREKCPSAQRFLATLEAKLE